LLVLTRKPGESLRIGGELRVTVVSAGNGQVRLAIEAPDDVAVLREEVFERVARANRDAARATDDVDESLFSARGARGEGVRR